MKTVKVNGRLTLRRQTIAALQLPDMDNIKGGCTRYSREETKCNGCFAGTWWHTCGEGGGTTNPGDRTLMC